MDSSLTFQVVLLVVLIILSAFFSMSETALMSLSKIRIRSMVEDEIKEAKLVEKLLEEPNKLLGAILIGNNIANIGASAIATSVALKLYGDSGAAIATGVMTILILIFGEITPKSLANQYSEKVAIKVSKLVKIIVTVFKPFVAIFTGISSIFIRLFGGDPNKAEPFITEEELKTMVDVSEKEGVLEDAEKEMIFNVFDFSDTQVKDIMIQRVDVVALDATSSYEKVMKLIKEEQFSRIPVFNETIDNIVGILNVKDLIIEGGGKDNFDLLKYTREPFYTFEFKKVKEIFNEMKKTRNHIAVVLDEYGGTVGIITIEDLIEEIVGEIEDEYDEGRDDTIKVVKDNEYIVDGSVKLHDISDLIGASMESEDFDSIGGLILEELGRIPEKNEEIKIGDIKLVVEDLDKNRIKKVRIYT